MATRMQQRRGTAADWSAANPVLAAGEIGFESDTGVIKVGDGVTAWNTLISPFEFKSLYDAKGDIIVASADNTPSRLARGATGQRLTVMADGSLAWQNPVDVSSFETSAHAASTYETQAHAASTYETQAAAAAFETSAHAASTYETQAAAAALPKGRVTSGQTNLASAAGTNSSTTQHIMAPAPFNDFTFTVDVTRRYRIKFMLEYQNVNANSGIRIQIKESTSALPAAGANEAGNTLDAKVFYSGGTNGQAQPANFEYEVVPGSLSAGVHHIGLSFRCVGTGPADVGGVTAIGVSNYLVEDIGT